MHRERLEKIRDHLRDNVKDERFNLGTWAGNEDHPWEGKPDLSCGTVACVMGHATTIPEFQALGLRLEKTTHRDACGGFLVYGEYSSFDAAAEFLDMNVHDVEYLFDPIHYDNEDDTDRMEVVDRITEFLERKPIKD